MREPPDATAWSRLHTRQAFVFGLAASVAYFAILALPFVVVIIASSLSTTAIVWLYGFGVLADFAAAIVWLAAALRYRARALRGELFSIPVVTSLADRLARSEA